VYVAQIATNTGSIVAVTQMGSDQEDNVADLVLVTDRVLLIASTQGSWLGSGSGNVDWVATPVQFSSSFSSAGGFVADPFVEANPDENNDNNNGIPPTTTTSEGEGVVPEVVVDPVDNDPAPSLNEPMTDAMPSQPSASPSVPPSDMPSLKPSVIPSSFPSDMPSLVPSVPPTSTTADTATPPPSRSPLRGGTTANNKPAPTAPTNPSPSSVFVQSGNTPGTSEGGPPTNVADLQGSAAASIPLGTTATTMTMLWLLLSGVAVLL
jgi:hypothetical protein